MAIIMGLGLLFYILWGLGTLHYTQGPLPMADLHMGFPKTRATL